MTPPARLSRSTVNALHASQIIGLRAGLADHRFIAVWVVVVDDRVFVRPWNDKPAGWYRAFLEDPRGVLQLGECEIKIRTRRSRGERLMDAIDNAYKEKYRTPGAQKWVRGFATRRRRSTTLELLAR